MFEVAVLLALVVFAFYFVRMDDRVRAQEQMRRRPYQPYEND